MTMLLEHQTTSTVCSYAAGICMLANTLLAEIANSHTSRIWTEMGQGDMIPLWFDRDLGLFP